MKMNKFYIRTLLFLLVTALLLVNACKEDDEVYPRTRLFQPVLNENLKAQDNTILVDLGKMKEAVSYTIEVSRDSFATIDYTFQADTNYIIINEEAVGEELLWYTIYQIRVTAIAGDPEYNSLPSFLGNVRTDKFPSNQGAPGFFDVTDRRAKVFWVASGQPINGVKVYTIDDIRLTSPLLEFEVTDEERAEGFKIISGLEPLTEYQIAIYSDDDVRGWEVYMTKEAEMTGDNVVDLTGIDDPNILANTLPTVADGSIILLEGGMTYNTGGYSFDKSVDIRSGYSFTPALPLINCSSNFDLADGANVESIVFKNIALSGSFGGNYAFNIGNNGTIGELKFESCQIRSLRGIVRMKGGVGTLDKYTITDCVVDSINGYGIISVDKNTWMCNDILLENSTFSKIVYFLVSRNNSNTVVLDGCTINEAPEKGRQMFRWRESGQDNVTNGITIKNTIWGHGWNMAGEDNYLVDGFDGLGNTNWNIVNTYATGDFGIAGGKDEIPGFPSFTYSGTAAELWTDAYFTVDFSFLDTGFSGKGDTGDPRWRVTL